MDGSRSDNGSSLHIHKVDFLRWGHSLRQSSSDKSYFLSGLEKIQGGVFRFVSRANVHHGFWFWTSLGMVFLGDIFVWAVAEGVLSDPSFRI